MTGSSTKEKRRAGIEPEHIKKLKLEMRNLLAQTLAEKTKL
jgi:hypothetical protein